MFTQTHALAGWAIGRQLKGGDDNLAPLACAFGAVIPDIPLITQIVCNWSGGLGGREVISPMSDDLTQMMHSILVWLIIGSVMIFQCRRAWFDREIKLAQAWSFLIGVFVLHIGIDALTHVNMPIGKADYLWPSTFHLSTFSGFWNYSRGTNSFMPRWQEWVMDIGLFCWITWTEFLSRFFTRPINPADSAHAMTKATAAAEQ